MGSTDRPADAEPPDRPTLPPLPAEEPPLTVGADAPSAKPSGKQQPSAPPERRSTSRLWAVGAFVLLAALAAFGVVVLTGGDDDPQPAAADRPAERTTPSTSPPPSTTATTVPPAPTSVRLAPTSVDATSWSPDSQTACFDPVSYGPGNAVDGVRTTAWQVTGDGTGQSITFELPPGTTVTRVGLTPGYDKVDPCDRTDRFTQNRRVTSVEWELGGETIPQSLATSRRAVQRIRVGAVETTSVTMRITGTVVGDDPGADTPISEIVVFGYTTGSSGTTPPVDPSAAVPAGRHATEVQSYDPVRRTVTVDVVRYLTGPELVRHYADRQDRWGSLTCDYGGGEYGPYDGAVPLDRCGPTGQDQLIVNDRTELEELPVAPGADFLVPDLSSGSGDSTPGTGQDFAEAVERAQFGTTYWIEVDDDGLVTGVEFIFFS